MAPAVKTSNLHVCHLCPFKDREGSQWVCSATPARAHIGLHAKEGNCPRDYFTIGLPEDSPAPLELTGPTPEITNYRRLWNKLHRRPLDFRDGEEERQWLPGFLASIPGVGCKCKNDLRKLLDEYPPDLSSAPAYFRWSVLIHNAVNKRLGKPEISDARAARIHGCTRLFSRAELAQDTAPILLHINSQWSLGDAVVLTSTIRDLQSAYPGEYEISVTSKYAPVFEGLGVSTTLPETSDIRYEYPVQYGKHKHFIQYARERLEATLGRPIPQGQLRPHLVLSDVEKQQEPPCEGSYWVLVPGFKLDATVKGWPAESWQEVINGLREIKFVAVGGTGSCDIQPELSGVIDLRGKTTLRQLFALIGHPNCRGVVSAITGPLHIGAAFRKSLVTIAGAREPDWVARYPDSQWLQVPMPCSGCWKYRVEPLNLEGDPLPQFDKSLCVLPDRGFAGCMRRIKAGDVIAAVRRYEESSILSRWIGPVYQGVESKPY